MKINNIELQDDWSKSGDVGYAKYRSDISKSTDIIHIYIIAIYSRGKNSWNVRFFENLYYLQDIWNRANYNTSIINGDINYVRGEIDKFLNQMSNLSSFI